MARAYASVVIAAPAEAVWRCVRDFASLSRWNGQRVVRCEIEENKAGDQVGAIRNFVLANGANLREQLVAYSDCERSYCYEFRTSPFNVDNYRATLNVRSITENDTSFVEWFTVFDCEVDQRDHLQSFFASQVFAPALASLRSYLGVASK